MEHTTRPITLSVIFSVFLMSFLFGPVFAQPKSLPLSTHNPLLIQVTSIAKPKNVYVSAVRCIRATSGSKQDEIRLEAYDKSGSGKIRGYSRSHKMKAGDVLGPIFSTDLKSGIISLVEVDSFSANDTIGLFRFNESTRAGRYIKKMSGDGGDYEVTIEVRPYHSIENGGMGKVLN